jgi:very-short-patch-repair endonuclease
VDRAIAILVDACTHETLPEVCAKAGLPSIQASGSKRERIRERFLALDSRKLLQAVLSVAETHGKHDLKEEAFLVIEQDQRPITEITRRDVAKCLEQATLQGSLDLIDFLERIWPDIEWMGGRNSWGTSIASQVTQHMVRNDDWTIEELFVELGVLHCSRHRFEKLLELTVSPLARRGEGQLPLVECLNSLLRANGYLLEIAGYDSGHPIFEVKPIASGVTGRPKNLIFASSGPKPVIGFSDAINNDVLILEHESSCLVYDRPIPPDGLLWRDLVDWYRDTSMNAAADDTTCRKALGKRLTSSLASPPETLLFRTYFKAFSTRLGSDLPALVPQVYLHYDPAAVSRLRHRASFPRQRMDFLLLLPQNARVVIEVDGQQHYASDDGKPSPERYAEMVSADRDLRLLGYEIYRFGGKELTGDAATELITRFFERLFASHGVGKPIH